MSRILVGGAGGAPSEGVIRSLLDCGDNVIGIGSDPLDLATSYAERKYVVPRADNLEYKEKLMEVINRENPEMVHFQNDLEIFYVSKMREDIMSTGTKLFMPSDKTINICVNKWESWKAFMAGGLIVPQNIFINDESDLQNAFNELGNEDGKIWLRSTDMGGGGIGSIPTNDYYMAKAWIDRYNGWGKFIAAEMLTNETITFLSIWWHGELVVGQTRKRTGWVHGNRAPSGVTGVTKAGTTCSDDKVTEVAINAVRAVDNKPHGIFGVDMAYDKRGIPNPTEINISRFFTTIYFFTKAGLNLPQIYKDLAINEKMPELKTRINPLPNGLMWIRAMDKEALLTTVDEVKERLIVI